MTNGKLKRKLNSRAGETIFETLASLLIAALALFMLAGAIAASTSAIVNSRDRLGSYYNANEQTNGVVKMATGGSALEQGITITDGSNAIAPQNYKITFFENDTFSDRPVIAYQLSK